MRNQRGITIVSLVITIVIMFIIASITITNSIGAYKTMAYQTFKSELEEIQSAVNETCENYLIERSLNNDLNYSNYFTNKFGSSPTLVGEAISEEGVQEIISLYAALAVNSQYTFYFNTEDIKTYFGLEVTLKGVIVDFSTRYVYSVEGMADPTDDTIIYYTLAEMDGETNIYKNEESSASSTIGLIASNDNSDTLYSSRRYKAFESDFNF